MFDSGISASDLIANLKTEIDVSLQIPNKTYIIWLNSLEQLLYSEFVKEQKKYVMNAPMLPVITISTIIAETNENQVRFEDIYTMFADGVELSKTSVNSGSILPNTYYKTNNNIGINSPTDILELDIIYFVRPALKTVGSNDVIGAGNVMLPYEFIDLMKAKLRGEAYKLANEDLTASKWLNDYNVLLENFKGWLAQKQARFGM